MAALVCVHMRNWITHAACALAPVRMPKWAAGAHVHAQMGPLVPVWQWYHEWGGSPAIPGPGGQHAMAGTGPLTIH